LEYMWMLHLLVFVFGYVTCKTFYFLRSTRTSIITLQKAQTCALYIAVCALEHYSTAQEFRIQIMKENDYSEQNIQAFKYRVDGHVVKLKAKFIKQIIEAHDKVFKDIIEFTDWPTAMVFLGKNKKTVQNFIKRS
jgi:hypothetical protein